MAGETIAGAAASAKRSADEAGQEEATPSHHKYAEMARVRARVRSFKRGNCFVKKASRTEQRTR
jgi:hypothetical protein